MPSHEATAPPALRSNSPAAALFPAAGNLPTLKVAGVQVASLANNHIADWGMDGLLETLEALQGAGGVGL